MPAPLIAVRWEDPNLIMAKKPKSYEGSPADRAEDARGMRATGKKAPAYENSARDKREDKAGQKKMFTPFGKKK
jgi:hypothetical protein